MKFCPECGNSLENTPKFCPECGADLLRMQSSGPESQAPGASSWYRRPAVVAGIAVAALAVAVVGYFALSDGADLEPEPDVAVGTAEVEEAAPPEEPEQAIADDVEGSVYYVVCASAQARAVAEARMQEIARSMELDPSEIDEVFFVDVATNYDGISDGPWLVMNGPWTDREAASLSLDTMRPHLTQGECYVFGFDDGGATADAALIKPFISEYVRKTAKSLGGTSQTGRELYFVVVATEASEAAAMDKRDAAESAYGEQMYFIVEHSDHLDGFAPGYWLVVEAYSRKPDVHDMDWYSRVATDAYMRLSTVLCDDPIPVVNELN